METIYIIIMSSITGKLSWHMVNKILCYACEIQKTCTRSLYASVLHDPTIQTTVASDYHEVWNQHFGSG